MWPLLIVGGLVIGLIAFTSKTAGAAGSAMGRFTPVGNDAALGSATALVLVALPGSKDDEVTLSNAVFKAGVNIVSLSEAQATNVHLSGMNVARFGGNPVGIARAPLTGELNQPLIIQARMANLNVPSVWIVLTPQLPSTFSIQGYSVIATAPAGDL